MHTRSLIGIALNLNFTFGGTNILTVVNLKLLCLHLLGFHKVLLLYCRSHINLVKLIPRYFTFLVYCKWYFKNHIIGGLHLGQNANPLPYGASFPYGCCFLPLLLHFVFRTLIMAWENTKGQSKSLGHCIHMERKIFPGGRSWILALH